jgi:rod shape-determining protein MreC
MDQIRIGRVRTQQQRSFPTGVVAALTALIVVLSAFPDGRALAQGLLARVFAPMQLGTARALETSGDFFGNVARAGSLAGQNQSYREEIRQLQVTLAQMRDLEAENRDLRALLGLRERLPLGKLTPAQIVARDPLSLVQAVVIDRGSDDGLTTNLPLVTDRGVVGRLVEVFPSTAKALLLTDVNSGIAVRTEGPESRGSGLVRGTGDGRLVLQYVAQDETIRPGDQVLTSGVGGTFPAGLLVGTITQIRQSDVGVFQEALVDPAVRARNLERVYVLSKP